MPIAGLTDNMPSFKEIGRLRNGKPKTEGLGDLDYFRPDFRPDETEAATRFTQFYGATPKWVYVRLPFPQIERCWDANFEVYNKAGMLGSAGGKTGELLHWFYLRDPKTGEVKVKNGEPFTPFDPKVPVYSYKNKKGEDVGVFAKATGRLRVVVPETGKLNYMTLITHSLYDIANISEQLQGIDYIAKNIGMSLSTVPLVMSRRWELRSVSYNGRKEMKELNLVNIDVRSDWAGKQFGFLDQLMPGQTPAILTLPAQVIDYGDEDQEPEYQDGGEDYDPTQTDAGQFPDGDGYEDSDFDPSDLDAPLDEEVDAVEVPARYTPETLREALQKSATSRDSGGATLSIHPKTKRETDRDMLAPSLENCFAGDSDSEHKRKVVLSYLWGVDSVKPLSAGKVLATKKWLNVTKDSGDEWRVDPLAIREAQAVYRAALIDEGQTVLPL